MYYGVIGKPMEIAITDILKVGQLVKSRAMLDERGVESHPYGDEEVGIVVELEEVPAVGRPQSRNYVVKILWQRRGTIEPIADWYAAELLEPIPS